MLERGHGRIGEYCFGSSFSGFASILRFMFANKAYVLSFTEALAEEVRGRKYISHMVCPARQQYSSILWQIPKVVC
ncbi:MAG: hypothetical protein IPG70_06630 [Moraxellaceae bacterium]|nr:hypothetical protein [Moraxellaceae bacterium]